MSDNNYSAWLPIEGVGGRAIVESLQDSDDGLIIYLHLTKNNEPRKFKIVFDPYIAYRNSDESYRSRTFSEHGGFENSLNLVGNSSWLEWLQSESLGYYKDAEIKHYSIVTDADFIDVLSEFPPDVEWVD